MHSPFGLVTLKELNKKNVKFVWTLSCQEAHNKLIQLLISPSIFTYPDYDRPFIITTDASGKGIGKDGIENPLVYYSRKLYKIETKYPMMTCRD